MTIEIRELVIQAKVVSSQEPSPFSGRSIAQEKRDEAQFIERVTQRVLDKLRENGGWIR